MKSTTIIVHENLRGGKHMFIVYIIGSAILMGAGYALGCMRTTDKAKASYRAARPAEIHSAVKDLDVALSGVRGRGW